MTDVQLSRLLATLQLESSRPPGERLRARSRAAAVAMLELLVDAHAEAFDLARPSMQQIMRDGRVAFELRFDPVEGCSLRLSLPDLADIELLSWSSGSMEARK